MEESTFFLKLQEMREDEVKGLGRKYPIADIILSYHRQLKVLHKQSKAKIKDITKEMDNYLRRGINLYGTLLESHQPIIDYMLKLIYEKRKLAFPIYRTEPLLKVLEHITDKHTKLGQKEDNLLNSEIDELLKKINRLITLAENPHLIGLYEYSQFRTLHQAYQREIKEIGKWIRHTKLCLYFSEIPTRLSEIKLNDLAVEREKGTEETK